MKVKRKVPERADMFIPMVIELETYDEARAMWYRLNMPVDEIKESMDLTSREESSLKRVATQMLHRFDDEYHPDEGE